MRWFPFDVQRCDLKFGSWTYGGWSLDLQMLEVDITGYIANGEWDLVGRFIQKDKLFIYTVFICVCIETKEPKELNHPFS